MIEVEKDFEMSYEEKLSMIDKSNANIFYTKWLNHSYLVGIKNPRFSILVFELWG